MSCAMCNASRRAVGDAFLLGFRAGFHHAVAATLEGEGKPHDVEVSRYCLRHEIMVTETMASEIRACMGLPPSKGGG